MVGKKATAYQVRNHLAISCERMMNSLRRSDYDYTVTVQAFADNEANRKTGCFSRKELQG